MIIYAKTAASLVLKKAVEDAEAAGDKCHTRVAGLIEGLNVILKFLDNSPNKYVYETLWKLAKKNALDKSQTLLIPNNIKGIMTAAIVGISRKKRREFILNNKYASKKQTKILENAIKKHDQDYDQKLKELYGP